MRRAIAATVMSGGLLLAPLGLAGTAGAQPLAAAPTPTCYPTCNAPGVTPPDGQAPAPAGGVNPAVTTSATTGSLAFTGADVAEVAGLGAALVGAGLAVMRLTRRRRPA